MLYLFMSKEEQPCVLWLLPSSLCCPGSESDGVCSSLLGASRYQHAQGGDGGLRGRTSASGHFAQAANVRLPGGDLFRGHVTAGVFG